MKTAGLLLALLLIVSTAYASEQIRWIQKYDQAVAEAQKTSRPIFVDVYADWCQWCHKLDQEVYADAKFVTYLKGYVPLKVDSEDHGEGARLADKYQVDGLPAMLVLDRNGVLLNKLSGFMTADEMIRDLTRVQKLLELERKDPKSDEANFLLAKEYIDHEMYSEAQSRFQRTLNSPKSTDVQKEKAQFSVGLAEYYLGQLKPALAVLEAYYTKYPNGSSNEDALLLLSQIHMELKSNRKAVQYLREFIKKYPNSSSATRAKTVLEALEKECPTC
ncbi:MAG TPA: thioredoxin family protein [Acidobacteriota bacterium]|nr:thioredoxin family protein [Acidobacteriota bacterium]